MPRRIARRRRRRDRVHDRRNRRSRSAEEPTSTSMKRLRKRLLAGCSPRRARIRERRTSAAAKRKTLASSRPPPEPLSMEPVRGEIVDDLHLGPELSRRQDGSSGPSSGRLNLNRCGACGKPRSTRSYRRAVEQLIGLRMHLRLETTGPGKQHDRLRRIRVDIIRMLMPVGTEIDSGDELQQRLALVAVVDGDRYLPRVEIQITHVRSLIAWCGDLVKPHYLPPEVAPRPARP